MKRGQMRKHWRSREELHQTPSFLEASEHEFTDDLDISSPEPEGTSRRGFLGWVGASLAASGLSGCIRRPEEKILPYSVAAEEILPSIPQYYASATTLGGEVVGVLVESHEGRPTKMEGNPLHRSNVGGLNNFHQSMILDLYDPQCLRSSVIEGDSKGLDEVKAFIRTKGILDKTSGKKVAILAEAIPSPQLDRLRTQLKTDFTGSQWFTYESISDDSQRTAMKSVFGKAVSPRYSFKTETSRAEVILSFDGDFLALEGPLAYASEWSATRKINDDQPEKTKISRMYSIEARYSMTASNADHRVRVSYAEVEAFACEIAKGLGIPAPSTSIKLDGHKTKIAQEIVKDLKSNVGASLAVAGRGQPPIVHALAALINEKQEASKNNLVKYYPDFRRESTASGDMESITALTAALNKGQVDTLIIMGVNPVYSAPSDLKFVQALSKAGHVIYLADQKDDTAQALEKLDKKKTAIIPRAHFLEAWGDLAAIDGQIALQQPLIQPIHDALSEIEFLSMFLGDVEDKGYRIVRNEWKKKTGAAGFHKRWRRWLHEGVVDDQYNAFSAITDRATSLGNLTASKSQRPSGTSMDLLFFAGYNSFDGRFANNSWLQELPDPMTKITWDNAALLSPATARSLGIEDEDMVKIDANGASIESVAWIMPGQADNTVVLTLGYGRKFENYLPYHEGSYNESDTPGFDVNPLRSSKSPFATFGAKIAKMDKKYDVAAVQRYANSSQEPGFGYEARPLVREAGVTEYKENPSFASPGIIKHGEKMPDASKHALLHPEEKSIFGDFDYSKGLQWGMVIDLNTCIGCNACMVACVAENNISMVGKDQVRRGREMHWQRIDRYFVGDEDNPEVVHQPISCQQCETAPCENVCPVAATVHSPEGLNDMVYNRCIGTRYCANNCPFKVRRFNFYNYSKGQDELIHMGRNPNVTVRFRGVMEKCTYCVQRLNKAKRRAALNPEVSQQIIDNISTACGQSCPTGGVAFGNLNDPNSAVARLKKSARDYTLLSELNLQSRTSFLAKIRNPNPQFPKKAEGKTQAG
jgi:molybdopterin-containing oxidoreductase family iron-sulfur binding subunit